MANNKLFSDKDFIIRIRHDDKHHLQHEQLKISNKIKNKILYYNKEEFTESISVDLFKNSRDASSGAMLLQFILDCIEFKTISIFGFDFFKSSNDNPSSSNEFKSFFYNYHNKNDEEQYFMNLILDYKGTDKLNFYE